MMGTGTDRSMQRTTADWRANVANNDGLTWQVMTDWHGGQRWALPHWVDGWCSQCGWSMRRSTQVVIEVVDMGIVLWVEGWARCIKINLFCRAPYGPPSARVSPCYLWPLCYHLWPPNVSPHCWKTCGASCDMAKFRQAKTKLSNRKSIRISTISVEKRLTNDVYRFPGLGDQCEVRGREGWWLMTVMNNCDGCWSHIRKFLIQRGL